jgi:tubulin polyglutamylase TTLL1
LCFTGYNAKDGPDARWKTAEERKAENEKTESYIVSRYVQDPLLIGGKKFDLRVYVVVTSYRPLRAFVSRLGFARFCSVSYSEAKADMDNPFVHLTNGTYCSHRPRRTPRGTLNPKPLSSIHASIIHLTFIHSFIHAVAIQKKGEDYNASHGNKWAIHLLRLYIEGTMGKEVADTLFRQIDEAIVYSLKSVQNVIINDRRCFELYG